MANIKMTKANEKKIMKFVEKLKKEKQNKNENVAPKSPQ